MSSSSSSSARNGRDSSTSTFNSKHRDSLCRILQVVLLIKSFHNNFTCTEGNNDHSFQMQTGERKGCVMSTLLFNITIRDLMIRQQGRPWKLRWKIDSTSFQTTLWLSQVGQLPKRREFVLELKRGFRTRVQTQGRIYQLPFPSSIKLKIWSSHAVVVQGQQRNVQKSVMHVQSCCFAN